MNYTIESFWKSLLSAQKSGTNNAVKGWKHIEDSLPTFVEAPISLVEGFVDDNPYNSDVILVSAPGAVGKSTLAREIAYNTGAMLVDLAEAEPIGANTLVGGLADTDLLDAFNNGEASLIVDGLDEARLHVPQNNFSAFLKDVVKRTLPPKTSSSVKRKPIVLLGRTAVIEEAWLWLTDMGIEAPILQIEYFDGNQALEFAHMQAKFIRNEETSREPDRRAISLLVNQITEQTSKDKNNFAGYSPVLIAIAKAVADPDDKGDVNTQNLIRKIIEGEQKITLPEIAKSILVREQGKLRGLDFQDENLHEELYTQEEQLTRLAARIYQIDPDISLPHMSPKDQQTYNDALADWVLGHPFLAGEGTRPSSEVFGGLIAAHAILKFGDRYTQRILDRELGGGGTANPFFADFFLDNIEALEDEENDERVLEIAAEHVGLLYESSRARLSLGETSSLSVDGETVQNNTAEVEFSRQNRDGDEIETHRFFCEADGHFLFGHRIEDVDIVAPLAHVSVGFGREDEVIFAAPVSIEVGTLELLAKKFVAESSRSSKMTESTNVIFLRAELVEAAKLFDPPVVRSENVKLGVSWLDSNVDYRWRNFSVVPTEIDDSEIYRAMNSLKRILRLFKTGSSGQLTKYKGAIDHRRRAGGYGACITELLVEESILAEDRVFYTLYPERLRENVGLNAQDVRTTSVSDTELAFHFLRRAIEQDEL